MTPMNHKELEKVASKKAMGFIEEFIKKKGSEIPPREVRLFENVRPALEGIYTYAYQVGYADALERMMEDTR